MTRTVKSLADIRPNEVDALAADYRSLARLQAIDDRERYEPHFWSAMTLGFASFLALALLHRPVDIRAVLLAACAASAFRLWRSLADGRQRDKDRERLRETFGRREAVIEGLSALTP